MARERGHRTEGSLLVGVIFILAIGFFLVFLAKTREGVPTDAIDVNLATTENLAVAFEIDPTLSDLIVQHRRRLGSFQQVQQLTSLTVFPTPEEAARVRETLQKSGLDVNAARVDEFQRTLELPRPIARRIVAYRENLPEARFAQPQNLLRTPILERHTLDMLGNRLIVRHPAAVLWRFLLMGSLTAALFLLAPIFLRKAGVAGDPFLLPLALLLAGFGVMALFSLRDPIREAPIYAHHIQGICLGIGALFLGALMPARNNERRGLMRRLPVRHNLRHYTYVWAMLAILLLVALRLFGSGPEGVRLSLLGFQPVEVIKLFLIFFLAGYLASRGDLLSDALHRWRPPMLKGKFAKWGLVLPRWKDFGPILGMFAMALLLFLVVRDMGPALLLFGAFISTLYLVTGRTGIVVVGLLLMFGGGFLAYSLHLGVLPVRVGMWCSPWDNPHRYGMQLGQSYWAMASGGVWGTGLGLGATSTLPAGKNDLIFAALAEELGLIGGLTILILYVLLIWRGLRIALRTQNEFDRLLAVGLTTLLACQTFLLVAGVTGLLPLTGISLPFISWGNSALVIDFFILGMLRGISSPTSSGSVAVGAPKPLFTGTVRRYVTAFALGMLGLVGVGRLFYVQAFADDDVAGHLLRTPDADGEKRRKVNPRLLAIERAIQRGSIYDRHGKVVATSRLVEISEAMGDDPDRARRVWRKGRYYPHGPAFAHLIGYLDPAIGGPTDLEKQFHDALRGFKSYSELVSDYRSKDLPVWLTRQEPRRGTDLILSLDADLQEAAFRILKRQAGALTDQRTKQRKDRAAMVVLDPLTGEVLVSASIPAYDPNGLTPEAWKILEANADGSSRLVDRSVQGYYPPGSTLKVATAGTALEDGVELEYDCNHVAKDLRWTYGREVFARRQLLDDKGDPPHDRIRMVRALKVSCNLYFANLGLKLGAERLRNAFADPSRWGFSKIKPVPIFAAELPTNAFGQGNILVTPLEMARIAAAVANRGTMMEPIYWKELRGKDKKEAQRNTPSVRSRPLGEANARTLGEMMRGVVTEGTARGVFDNLSVEVAGKTGTAQNEEGDREPHSWFIGYTPYSRPQYAFACVIENGGYGKKGAAPALRDMLDVILRK